MTDDAELTNSERIAARLRQLLAELDAEEAKARSTVELIKEARELDAEEAKARSTVELIKEARELDAAEAKKAGAIVDLLKSVYKGS